MDSNVSVKSFPVIMTGALGISVASELYSAVTIIFFELAASISSPNEIGVPSSHVTLYVRFAATSASSAAFFTGSVAVPT